MVNNRYGPFRRALEHFQYDHMFDNGIRRIEKTSIKCDKGPWMYAIKVVIDQGKGGHLPKLYCGYNIIVIEENIP